MSQTYRIELDGPDADDLDGQIEALRGAVDDRDPDEIERIVVEVRVGGGSDGSQDADSRSDDAQPDRDDDEGDTPDTTLELLSDGVEASRALSTYRVAEERLESSETGVGGVIGYLVLSYIADADEPVTSSEVADGLPGPDSTLTSTLSSLYAAGCIERDTASSTGFSGLYAYTGLTEYGRAELLRLRAVVEDFGGDGDD